MMTTEEYLWAIALIATLFALGAVWPWGGD